MIGLAAWFLLGVFMGWLVGGHLGRLMGRLRQWVVSRISNKSGE